MKTDFVFHYGDEAQWEFYRKYFDRLPEGCRKFVTIRSDYSPQTIHYTRIQSDLKNAILVPIENRGLDTGAFLLALDRIFRDREQPDLILKVHSKSTRNTGPFGEGPAWRQTLMDSLVGSKERTRACIRIFESCPDIGMVGSGRYLIQEPYRAEIDRYAREVLGLVHQSTNRFVAGTMFWVRFPILKKAFGGKDLRGIVARMPSGRVNHDYEPHWLERIYGNIVFQQGLRIQGV